MGKIPKILQDYSDDIIDNFLSGENESLKDTEDMISLFRNIDFTIEKERMDVVNHIQALQLFIINNG